MDRIVSTIKGVREQKPMVLIVGFLVFFLFLAMVILGLFFQGSLKQLIVHYQSHYYAGMVAYVLFLIISVIFPLIPSLPIASFSGAVWGVMIASTLTILGWWLGGLIAFLLVRKLGRPFLLYFVSLEKFDEWEAKIPKDMTFVGIAFAQLILPQEALSFTLGFSKSITFGNFALATLLGSIPTTFLIVATGDAFLSKHWYPFIVLGVMVLVLLVFMYFMGKKYFAGKKKEK